MFNITYKDRIELSLLVRYEMTRLAEIIADDVVRGRTSSSYDIKKYGEMQALYNRLR